MCDNLVRKKNIEKKDSRKAKHDKFDDNQIKKLKKHVKSKVVHVNLSNKKYIKKRTIKENKKSMITQVVVKQNRGKKRATKKKQLRKYWKKGRKIIRDSLDGEKGVKEKI